MKRKSWLGMLALFTMVILFCRLVYGKEKNFIQPCSDAGGYRTWLKEPDGTYIDHLGHDYKVPTGTEVKAIGDGVVHDVNPSFPRFGGDKPSRPGPMIWIKHHLENGKYFFALYGHIESTKKVGEKVEAGGIIGTVFPFKIGEGLHPHLHFGIWNSENDPPTQQLGYGPAKRGNGEFVNPKEFIEKNKPYSERKIDEKQIGEKAALKGYQVKYWFEKRDEKIDHCKQRVEECKVKVRDAEFELIQRARYEDLKVAQRNLESALKERKLKVEIKGPAVDTDLIVEIVGQEGEWINGERIYKEKMMDNIEVISFYLHFGHIKPGVYSLVVKEFEPEKIIYKAAIKLPLTED